MISAQIYETLAPLNGQVNHNTLAFIRRANVALDKWWTDCDDLHSTFSNGYNLYRQLTFRPIPRAINGRRSSDV